MIEIGIKVIDPTSVSCHRLGNENAGEASARDDVWRQHKLMVRNVTLVELIDHRVHRYF